MKKIKIGMAFGKSLPEDMAKKRFLERAASQGYENITDVKVELRPITTDINGIEVEIGMQQVVTGFIKKLT